MREEEGVEIVKKIVQEWSKVYVSQVFFIDKFSNIYNYEVEFSKPTPNAPIPEGTVKVLFQIIEKANGEHIIEFNFENESLKHRLDQTMRTNMFESWIDRVLENKIKIKTQLHLGTEFEYTRLVDEKGKKVDPFVPSFDITKVTDLSKEMRKSQKVNVESPRFISTLKRALQEMFLQYDKNNTGDLDYDEFHEAFSNLSYGLTENDINILMALSDENNDGRIQWEEFVPIGIDTIKAFFARDKNLQRMKTFERDIDKEAVKIVFIDEIKKDYEILSRQFKKYDEKNEGFIEKEHIKKFTACCNSLNCKETNILLRRIKTQLYEYETKFEDDLYEIRFELSKSRLTDTNISKLEDHLLEKFRLLDTEKTGQLNILQIQDVLFKSKKVTLTPFSVQILIGYSQPDKNGLVDYIQFAKLAKDYIDELFSIKSLAEKSQMILANACKIPDDLGNINMSDLDIFKVITNFIQCILQMFKRYDRNQNGFLDIYEYIQCLKESDINLTQEQIITIGLCADMNGDGRVDYEEFMKHFKDFLRMIRLQELLHEQQVSNKKLTSQSTIKQGQVKHQGSEKIKA